MYAIIDTETTGLNPAKHEVIEVAVILVEEETWQVRRTYQSRIKPMFINEADARALATEYRDVVRGKGPDWVPKAPPFAGPAVRFRTREAVEADFLKALDEMSRDAHSAGLRVLQ